MDKESSIVSKESEFYTALSACQGEMPNPPKDKTVDFISRRTGKRTQYSYSDLASAREMIRPILVKHGFSIIQIFVETDSKTYLVTSLNHRCGHSVSSRLPLELGADLQEVGSRITYLRRYSLFSILGLIGEDDDDGEEADETDKIKREIKPTQSAAQSPVQQVTQPRQSITPPLTIATLKSEGIKNGWNIEQLKEFMQSKFKKSSSSAMTVHELEEMLHIVKSKDFMTALGEIDFQ